MDSLSQLVLGAAVADLLGSKRYGNKARLIGAILGTIPDLDVFVAPLLHIEGVDALLIHRTVTHSLFFSFLSAPLRGRLISRWLGKTHQDWRHRTIIAFRCLTTHRLLDLFTGYGTQRLRPFSTTFFSIDSVFVVDPLRTIPFLLLLGVALFYKPGHPERKKAILAGLLISTCYLLVGVVLQQVARHQFVQHVPPQTRLINTAVTPLNILLRRGLAEDQEAFYLARWSVYDDHPPTVRKRIPKQRSLLPAAAITRDLLRLQQRFHGDLIVTTGRDDRVIVSPVEFSSLVGRLSGSSAGSLMGFARDPQKNNRYSYQGEEKLPPQAVQVLRRRIQGTR